MEDGHLHFIGKVAQKIILEKDGKVLIVRDPREKQNLWEIPGGRLHENEKPADGLRRELLEELGAEVELGGVVHIDTVRFNMTGENHLVLVYRGTLKNPNQEFLLQVDEVAETRWIGPAELDRQGIYPNYRRALEVYFNLGDK